MRLSRRLHPEAEAEFEAAVDWYDDQQTGLGNDLLDLAEEAIELILEWPRIGQEFPGWNREPTVRSKAIERFPYRVLYYRNNTEIVVVAFAHNSRKPGYWKDRV